MTSKWKEVKHQLKEYYSNWCDNKKARTMRCSLHNGWSVCPNTFSKSTFNILNELGISVD